MSRNKKDQVELQGLTRREILKYGGQGLVGVSMLPWLEKMLSVTPALAATQSPVYLHFALRGGYSFTSDFVALTAGGNQLPASVYAAHGANPSLGMTTTWGAPMWNRQDGTTSTKSLPAQLAAANIPSSVQFATFAAMHGDDTGSWVTPIQLVASHLTRAADTSTDFQVVSNPMVMSSYGSPSDLMPMSGFSPVIMSSVADFQALVNPQVGPLSQLSVSQMSATAELARSMTLRHTGQLSAAAADNSDILVKALTSGANATTRSFAAAGTLPTPFGDARLSAFGLTSTMGNSSPRAVLASMVKMLIDGQTRTLTFHAPGLYPSTDGLPYDLHALAGPGTLGQQAYTLGMDFYSSYLIPTIATLVAQGIPFFIDVSTDGSGAWSNSVDQGGWPLGDHQSQSMVVSVAFKPGVAKPFAATHVGGYLAASGTVDLKASAVSTSEMNTAIVRAASALKLFGIDPGQEPVLVPLVDKTIT